MKNPSDTTENQARNLPACSTVPKPTALLRAPLTQIHDRNTIKMQVQVSGIPKKIFGKGGVRQQFFSGWGVGFNKFS
jgi:hypothetical protein